MLKSIAFFCMALAMLGAACPVQAATSPVVLELFTSQGCSSCPPADALLQTMTGNPALLPLSFHIDYWDRLGWKDPFSSPANSARQYGYAKAMGEGNVFTPQLIVNGTESVVGSRKGAVQDAVADAAKKPSPVIVALTPAGDGKFALNLSGAGVKTADLWEVRFVTHATTPVGNGENGGRTLESSNNVTAIKRLGAWPQDGAAFSLPPLAGADDGIAVLAQMPGQGRIVGAAAYIKQGQ